MATNVFSSNLTYLENADNVLGKPGLSPNPYKQLAPAAQTLAASPQQQALNAATQAQTAGIAALQQKTQGQYSNRQFIAPLNYQINVEGTWIMVDLLGKKINTNTSTAYRAISSLSAISIQINQVGNARNFDASNNILKQLENGIGLPSSVPGSATQNSAGLQFSSGTSAAANSLGTRFSQFTKTVTSGGVQTFSNLFNNNGQINVGTTITGLANQVIPTTQITQTVAKIPGLKFAQNALGQIPGTSNLTNLLQNPIGSVEGLIGQAAKVLNIQGSLPSLQGGEFNLGSLSNIFSLATDIYHNGPPTSLTGLISLEKQVKAIICNFVPPSIKLPSFKQLTQIKFPKLDDIEKYIKKEYEDVTSNIINALHNIEDELKSLVPDPNQIWQAINDEFTKCDKGPASQNNNKAGK